MKDTESASEARRAHAARRRAAIRTGAGEGPRAPHRPGPATHPPRSGAGGQGVRLPQEPRLSAPTRDPLHHPGQGRPGAQPPKARRPRRPAAALRPGRLPRTPCDRVRDQPPQKAPGGATRFDKLAVRFEATVLVAAIGEWLCRTELPMLPARVVLAREEYALSARTTSGRVRGRPTRRGMRSRAITSVKAGASPACPAVSTKARGRQLPSAARRIFVVSPPRERPMGVVSGLVGRSPPSAGSGRMLMCSNGGGVDGHHPAQVLVGVRLGRQGGEHSLPGPAERPFRRRL